MRRALLVVVAAAVVVLVPPTTARTAQAAPSLVDVVPANGAVVDERPDALVLTFSEDVATADVDLGDDVLATVDVGGRVVRVDLQDPPATTARAYVAAYDVAGVDGSRVSGEVGFTVDPGAEPPQPPDTRWARTLAVVVAAALALTLWTTMRRWTRARQDRG